MSDTVSNETSIDAQRTEFTGDISALLANLNAYLKGCHDRDEEKRSKKGEKFPNLAGFCRYLGCGLTQLEGLRLSNPMLYDHICAILEDEALNAEISPTVLNAYLKKRLGYAEKSEGGSVADCGPLRLIFEHDIMEDGS